MYDDSHDVEECDECQIRQLSVNNHSMEVIIPCYELGVYWICDTCDIIEFWPGYEPMEEFQEMLHTSLYLHCVDRLVAKII